MGHSAGNDRWGAVVVAAGAGTRFGADRPKALLELAGQPLVRHSAQAMYEAGADAVIIVIPDRHREEFETALVGLPVLFASGGSERTHSVRHGLASLQRNADGIGIVLVHDAARPLVPIAVVQRVVAAVAAGNAAVVPAVAVTDTIRELTDTGSRMLERDRLRAVQTPQGFELATLLDSYAALGGAVVSDDAGVCERVGHQVRVVEGDPRAFKITYPADLLLAERLLTDEAVPL